MASIYKGKFGGIDVCIKECFMPNAYAAETTENIMASEAAIHVQLQHRNVTRMYGFYNIGNSLYIVSELMDCTLDQDLHPPEAATEET